MFGFIDGEVIEVDPPQFLRCRWTIEGAATTLTIRLEVDDTGTVVRLEHVGLPPEPLAGFDAGWGDKLHHDFELVVTGQRDMGRSRIEGGLSRNADLEVPE
jgi:uncharacterized protein YndB with AHSA1/START domain